VRIFNTLTRRVEELRAGRDVSLYVCGVTPYETTHGTRSTTETAPRWRFEALTFFHNEARGNDQRVGLARLVVSGQAQRETLKAALTCAYKPVGAGDMADHQQSAPRPEYSVHLTEGCGRVGNTAQRQCADEGVEPVAFKREVLGVRLGKSDRET
jgi:hypothetical protein